MKTYEHHSDDNHADEEVDGDQDVVQSSDGRVEITHRVFDRELLTVNTTSYQ
jgi:hypothetical protein